MSSFFYYLLTFGEAVTSVFGLRFPYDQPHYAVIQDLGQNVEIRRYDPRLAVEVTIRDADRDKSANQAFGLLFGYLTGANRSEQKIAMTTPVRTDVKQIPGAGPIQTTSRATEVSMRFFLPHEVAEAGAPAPRDPRLHIVQVPATTVATRRFSGVVTGSTLDHQTAILLGRLEKSPWKPNGEVFRLSYDPPFTIPFLRRNEVGMPVMR